MASHLFLIKQLLPNNLQEYNRFVSRTSFRVANLCRKRPLLADVTTDHGNLTNYNTRNKQNNSTILCLSRFFFKCI